MFTCTIYYIYVYIVVQKGVNLVQSYAVVGYLYQLICSVYKNELSEMTSLRRNFWIFRTTNLKKLTIAAILFIILDILYALEHVFICFITPKAEKNLYIYIYVCM